MKNAETIKIRESLIIENFHKMSKKLGTLTEIIEFNKIKDVLQSLSSEKNLKIYNKPSNIDDLKQMITQSKGNIPQDGVLAVDDFTQTVYIFIISKDANKAKDFANSLQATKQFTAILSRNDDITGVFLGLIVISPLSNPSQPQS